MTFRVGTFLRKTVIFDGNLLRMKSLFIGALLLSMTVSAQKPYTGNYDEPYRPAFHFTPPSQWMNDPNGLVFYEGKYHLFYQYHPHSNVWGPMHWGHAESTDLVHWTQLPIALYPDEKGHIFSGSSVIDQNNTTGFGKDAMVAIYTYHSDELWKQGHKNTESQALAYSLDQGKTWTKYKNNPVLNNTGEQDFRDPKVFWNNATNKWIMVLAVHDMIRIFSSPNLKDWTFESNFQPREDAVLGVWECPDLFPMDYKGQQKWVMIVNHGDKAVNSGSGTRYFVGDFDGKQFTNETPGKWLDFGTDYYAAVTFGNVPDGKKIVQGWMSNWQYATKVPTEVWRSAMALPRELALSKDANGWFLRQETLSAMAAIKDSVYSSEWASLPFKETLPTESEVAFVIDGGTDNLSVTIGNVDGEKITLQLKDGQFSIDRTQSGKTDFSDKFASVQTMPVPEKIVSVQLFLDNSSVEVFLNEGKYVMTNLFFPTEPYNIISVSGSAKEIKHVDINKINNIWRKE